MTRWRLFAGVPGPGAPSPFEGELTAAVSVGFDAPVWVEGFSFWAPNGGDTGPQTFALQAITGGAPTASGQVVDGTQVASGDLVQDEWNDVFLPAPVPVMPGQYVVQSGWTSVKGFPFTANYWNGTGTDPDGITAGPMHAYSDGTQSGTSVNPWGGPFSAQGLFSTQPGSSNAADHIAEQQSDSGNFWIDLIVNDQVPAGYKGPFLLAPAITATAEPDTAVNYELATQVNITQRCRALTVAYAPAPGTSQQATWCGLWDAATRQLLTVNRAPAWEPAAVAGWVEATVPPVILTPGQVVKPAVWNDAADADQWSLKDPDDPWGPDGAYANGISFGPLTAPAIADALPGLNYDNVPPTYTDGTVIPHAQSTFGQTAPAAAGDPPFTELWANAGVGTGSQNYSVGLSAELAPARGSLPLLLQLIEDA